MASGTRQEFIAAAAITADGASTSSSAQLKERHRDKIALITMSGRTDGTYTLTIEHSADDTNWEQIATGSGLSANGIESVNFPDRHLPYIRLVITAASVTTGATSVEAAVFSEIRRI